MHDTGIFPVADKPPCCSSAINNETEDIQGIKHSYVRRRRELYCHPTSDPLLQINKKA